MLSLNHTLQLKSAIALTVLLLTFSFAAAQSNSTNQFSRFVLDDCVYREYLITYDSLRDAGNLTYDDKSNECNLDNKIYLPGREFIYDFYYRKGGKNYKFDFTNRETGLASCDYRLENTVFSFSYKILPGNIVGQTQTWYGYQGAFDTIQNFEISGIIENKMNVWLHPPRSEMFRMLEINPFPFIKFPLEIGAVWSDSLGIGDQWSDHRWLTWQGSIMNHTQRQITGKEIVGTALGKLVCYVVKSWSTSRLGTSYLTAYFNEQYGFVKLYYTNIDKSELVMSLIKVDE